MGKFIDALAGQVGGLANTAANTVLGMALARWNDRRQLRQQEKLNELSTAQAKELTEFNRAQQLQMWKDTNFAAQKEQIKAAGLNPGILYGQGGAGGATASVSAQGASNAAAPGGGSEILGAIGMGLQRRLAEAQVRTAEATAKKAEAETGAIGFEIEQIKANTENVKADTALTKMQEENVALENRLKGKSMDLQLYLLQNNVKKQVEELRGLKMSNDLTEETFSLKVQEALLSNASMLLTNENIKVDTAEKQSKIKKNLAEIANMAGMLAVAEKNADTSRLQYELSAKINDLSNTEQLIGKGITELVTNFLGDGWRGIIKKGIEKLPKRK